MSEEKAEEAEEEEDQILDDDDKMMEDLENVLADDEDLLGGDTEEDLKARNIHFFYNMPSLVLFSPSSSAFLLQTFSIFYCLFKKKMTIVFS